MTDQPNVKDADKEKQAKLEKFIQSILEKINWNEEGIIPVVTQDMETGLVLQLSWFNPEALRATLTKREVHFWSVADNVLIHQGADNNAVQKVAGLYVSHEADSILLKVMLTGSACDTGADTCFDRPLEELVHDS